MSARACVVDELKTNFQVETIGDAYMVVSGAPMSEDNHAEKVCDMALDMVDAITDLKDPSTGKQQNNNNAHFANQKHDTNISYT